MFVRSTVLLFDDCLSTQAGQGRACRASVCHREAPIEALLPQSALSACLSVLQRRS